MVAVMRRKSSSGALLVGSSAMIGGLNDAPEHARELADYLRGLHTCVNLIPYNPRENSPYLAPEQEAVERFQQILMDAGQLAFRRNTKGQQAMAACGQLGSLSLRRAR